MSIDTVDRVQMDVNDGRPNPQPAPAPVPATPPATTPVAPYKPGDPITVKLSSPLKTMGNPELRELTLRMPTMRAFRMYGEMVKTVTLTPKDGRLRGTAIEDRTENAFNYEAVVGYLSESTGISTIELDGLAGNDVEYLANTLLMMTRIRPQA